jgi:rubredoxin
MAQAMLTRCPTAAAAFTQQRSAGPARATAAPAPALPARRAAFFGTSPLAQRRGVAAVARRQQLAVHAAAKQISVEIEKPIGLGFKESKAKGGGLVVTNVGGNAAKSGIQKGDTIVYASSFFGDELWPTDSKGLTQSAIGACPSPVALVYVKGENNDVNVKRLPKKPAPKRFGRKLTAAQKEFATHICADCGWIYTGKKPFEELAPNFRCPQCSATKKRFAKYDAEKERKVGGTSDSAATAATVVVGLAGIAVLAVLGLSL